MAKSRGILLVALRTKGYAYMAHNLAYSIKYHSEDVKVHLIADRCIEYLRQEKRDVFDSISSLEFDQYHTNGLFDPGKLKTRIYDLSPFSETLYLDVDALCMQDPSSVLDQLSKDGRPYITNVEGSGFDGDEIPYNVWARTSDIVDYFGLEEGQRIYAIQSSWAFFRKSREASKFFTRVKKEYDRGFPMDRLLVEWGGGMPDELIYSGVLSKLEIDASGPEGVMFFGSGQQEVPVSEVVSNHTFLSLYGNGTGRTMTKLRWWTLYDNLLFKYTREHRNNGHQLARTHIYKSGIIKKSKHANNR